MKMKAGRTYGVAMVAFGVILGFLAWLPVDLPSRPPAWTRRSGRLRP